MPLPTPRLAPVTTATRPESGAAPSEDPSLLPQRRLSSVRDLDRDRQPGRDGKRRRRRLRSRRSACRRDGCGAQRADARRLRARRGSSSCADLDEVVAASELVLSIVPPDQATAATESIAASAAPAPAPPRSSPTGMPCRPRRPARSTQVAGDAGLEFVDGSISGGPPRPGSTTRIYLSGARADELAAATPPEIDARVVGAEIGLASAVKMCTAAMYKGSTALLAHSLLTAHAHGVLPQVLDDLHGPFPRQIDGAARSSRSRRPRRSGSSGRCARSPRRRRRRPDAGALRGVRRGLRRACRVAARARGPESIGHELALDDVLERLAPGGAAMRARGLEPPRAEAHRDLNPARLPVPPRPRGHEG